MPVCDSQVLLLYYDLQSELSEAKEIAEQSREALREKSVELERISTTKQQEGGSLRTTLQAKELELTKTMDKLLQVSFIIDLYMYVLL
jgi:flagellar biosynthesis chaperone FliJ